mgnify:CR=1 FL=1|jgi:hypothetical protein
MDIVIVERETAEWIDMWGRLEAHPINEGIENPRLALNAGELWQYMGSYRQGDKVIHSFRHRSHPRDNQRKDINFYASDKFTSEQISKVIKVK